VVLVHDQRDVRVGLGGGLDQVLDERLAGVLAGAGAGLQDDRRADLVGRGHHGLHLLQVVDVEGRNAVAVGSAAWSSSSRMETRAMVAARTTWAGLVTAL
jgi:hypothetical protein